jgi:hypothetical protein
MPNHREMGFLRLFAKIGVNRYLWMVLIASFIWAMQAVFLDGAAKAYITASLPLFIFLRYSFAFPMLVMTLLLLWLTQRRQAKRRGDPASPPAPMPTPRDLRKLLPGALLMGGFMFSSRMLEALSYGPEKRTVLFGSVFSIFLVLLWDFKKWVIYRLTRAHRHNRFVAYIHANFAKRCESVEELLTWLVMSIIITFTALLYMYGAEGALPSLKSIHQGDSGILRALGFALLSSMMLSFFYDLLIPFHQISHQISQGVSVTWRARALEVGLTQLFVCLSIIVWSGGALLANSPLKAVRGFLRVPLGPIEALKLGLGYVLGVTVIGYFVEHICLALYDDRQAKTYGEFRIRGRDWASLTATLDPFLAILLVPLYWQIVNPGHGDQYKEIWWAYFSAVGVLTLTLLLFLRLWNGKKEELRLSAFRATIEALTERRGNGCSVYLEDLTPLVLLRLSRSPEIAADVGLRELDAQQSAHLLAVPRLEYVLRRTQVYRVFAGLPTSNVEVADHLFDALAAADNESGLIREQLKLVANDEYGASVVFLHDIRMAVRRETLQRESRLTGLSEPDDGVGQVATAVARMEELCVRPDDINRNEVLVTTKHGTSAGNFARTNEKYSLGYVEEGKRTLRLKREFVMDLLSRAEFVHYKDLERKAGREAGDLYASEAFSISTANILSFDDSLRGESGGPPAGSSVWLVDGDLVDSHFTSKCDVEKLRRFRELAKLVVFASNREWRHYCQRLCYGVETPRGSETLFLPYIGLGSDRLGTQTFTEAVQAAEIRTRLKGRIVLICGGEQEESQFYRYLWPAIIGTQIEVVVPKTRAEIPELMKMEDFPLVLAQARVDARYPKPGVNISNYTDDMDKYFDVVDAYLIDDLTATDARRSWPSDRLVAASPWGFASVIADHFATMSALRRPARIEQPVEQAFGELFKRIGESIDSGRMSRQVNGLLHDIAEQRAVR